MCSESTHFWAQNMDCKLSSKNTIAIIGARFSATSRAEALDRFHECFAGWCFREKRGKIKSRISEVKQQAGVRPSEKTS